VKESITDTDSVIPSFESTTSPEMDSLLGQYRQQVFTPSALAKHHRALIYKKSRHQILQNDPGVTVTMSDDEEVRLQPMHEFDKPNTKKSLVALAKMLSETNDPTMWNNIIPFLEGLKQAKLDVPYTWMEKLTRKANEMGKAGVIIRAAEMAKKTGFRLSQGGVTKELMVGCHMRAVAARFQGDAFEKAAHHADHIALLLEDPLHCGGKLREHESDMRKDVTVIGVLLEMATARAVNAQNGKDDDGKVKNYLTKALALTRDTEFKPAPRTHHDHEPARLGKAIESWLPLWNGLKLVRQIEDIASGPQADELTLLWNKVNDAVHDALKGTKDLTQRKPRRALAMFDAVQEA